MKKSKNGRRHVVAGGMTKSGPKTRNDASFVMDPPVKVPHDGPLHHAHILKQSQQEEGNKQYCNNEVAFVIPHHEEEEEVGCSDASKNDALYLLRRLTIDDSEDDDIITADFSAMLLSDDNEDDETTAAIESASIELLKELVRFALDIQSQLAALRSYRSTVLHCLSRKQKVKNKDFTEEEEGAKDTPPVETFSNHYDQTNRDKTINGSSDNKILSGTYRILVELALSSQTPQAMGRAIRSSLEALRKCIPFHIVDNVHQTIAYSILLSTRPSCCCWLDPIATLFQATSYYDSLTSNHLLGTFDCIGQTLQVLWHVSRNERIHSTLSPRSSSSLETTRAVERGTEITLTLKLVMSKLLVLNDGSEEIKDEERNTIDTTLNSLLEVLLIPLMSCKTSNTTDALSKAGVVLGQVWLYGWTSEPAGGDDGQQDVKVARQLAAQTLCQLTDRNDGNSGMPWMNGLPELHILAAVKGVLATLPNSILQVRAGDGVATSSLLLNPIGLYMIDLCQHARDPAVRLSAVRGLDTIFTRILSITSLDMQQQDDLFNKDISILVEDALNVVSGTWENSSSKQVTCAIPSLFGNIIKVLKQVPSVGTTIDSVVERVLLLPPKKGRFIALELLLRSKSVSGSRLLELGGGSNLIATFLDGIGDDNKSNSSRVIATLMGNMLCQVRTEMNAEAGIVQVKGNLTKKERRRREREIKQGKQIQQQQQDEEAQSQLLPQWIDLWAGPFASALLSPVPRRRTKVAAFCLPILETMCGGPSSRTEVAHCCSVVLEKLNEYGTDSNVILWAKFEVVRQARNLKLTTASGVLQLATSQAIPRDLLGSALTHVDATIRLAAFSTLEAILPSYQSNAKPLERIMQEIHLWKAALPYAFKGNGKEHISQILKCLNNVLNRASNAQAEQETDSSVEDDIAVSFCGFLVNKLIVKCGAYPGTVADKESFIVPLAQSLLSFACDGKLLSSKFKEKKTTKNKGITNRRLTPEQISSRHQILQLLASPHVFCALMSLMHSMWDNSRARSYEFGCDLVNQALLSSIALPEFLTSAHGQRCWRARAIHLSSSPRQREADTGARMLGLLYSILASEERRQLLNDTLSIADDRISMMNKAFSVESTDGIYKQPLPLAYGLLHALRLMLEQNRMLLERDGRRSAISQSHVSTSKEYEDIAQTSSKAIEASLSIVADLKKTDEDVIKDNDEPKTQASDADEPTAKSATPLNVNSGAIGANAVYSSIAAGDQEMEEKRYALQRVIVGSWLLTKEACATLSNAIVEYPESPPAHVAESAGSLLISAMVSLKHQGASFAAHNALQRIAVVCYSSEHLLSLPKQWARRILHEISSKETVRDSTLRRSTGYALGLLSLMRSQPSLTSSSEGLCQDVLSEIVRLSLPSTTPMEKNIKKWTTSDEGPNSVFVFPSLSISRPQSNSSPFVDDHSYEIRTRVHGLNILRLAVLDAPLSPVTSKIVGDAFISAIIGYSDSSWRVRSSATMVFTAAMLRVVDTNKNASNPSVDQKGLNSTSGTAVTAAELFRCYPPLACFLRAALTEGIASDTDLGTLKYSTFCEEGQEHPLADEDHLHPALFPVLLLLSRLQPVAQSTTETSASELTDPFIEPVFFCMEHKHHKVRVMAARALSTLCTGSSIDPTTAPSSMENLLRRCSDLLAGTLDASSSNLPKMNYNTQHGLLLGVQALLHSSYESSLLFEDKQLFRVIEYFACWCNSSGACPPLCAKTALETWVHMHSVRNRTEIGDEDDNTDRLIRATFSVMKKMELLACDGNASVIGAAQLGMVSGKIACEISLDIIFSRTGGDSQRTKHIEFIEALLTSECYDVRLGSVKAFKKQMWGKVDTILSDPAFERKRKADFLAPVCAMLTKVLCSEMERVKNVNGGAHAPTLRRISRCLLECLSAYRSLRDVPDLPETDMTAENLWKTTTDMLELGCISVDDIEEASAGTSLGGNAIELLALILSSGMLRNDASRIFENKTKHFVRAISQCTDQTVHWVVRHSAAVAVGTSGILLDNFPSFCCCEKSTVDRLRLDSYLAILTFLQDSDVDVRIAAGTALSCSQSFPNASRLQSHTKVDHNSTTNHVPLLELEMAYDRVGRRYLDRDLTLRLLRTLLEECLVLKSNVQLVVNEFKCSESCLDGHGLLNLGSTRRIFEAEDSNPYSEPLVTCQLSACLLANSPPQNIDEEILDLMKVITSEYSSMIALIKSRVCEKQMYDEDLGHNLTWSSEVFPAFQGLILGSVVCVYLGHRNPSVTVRNTQDLLAALGESGRHLIHPCILEALQVLSEAAARDDHTRDGLSRACFLAPSKCSRSLLSSYSVTRNSYCKL